jgi:hypothetical protein
MKKRSLYYFFLAGVLGVIVAGVSVYSCEKEVITPNNADKMHPEVMDPKDYCGKTMEFKLVGENDAIIGSATVFNDTKYFYVKMKSSRDYVFGDAAMHIASRSDGFPLDLNGNPSLSLFKYKIQGQPLSTDRAIIVPLSSLNKLSYVTVNVQSKALHSTEKHSLFVSTWIDGRQYGNTVKGRVFTYQKQTCLTTEGVSDDQLTER